MSKPVIAVDIDDVLAASAAGFTDYSNKRWNTQLRADDYDENWAKFWGVSPEEAHARAVEVHESGVIGEFVHFEQAIPVLQNLKKRYDLVVVTSRRISVKPETAAWLDRHFSGIFTAVHHAGFYDDAKDHQKALAQNKAALCRALGADYLIDHQLKHCIGAAECGVQALLFGNYTWNRIEAHEVLNRQITIVHNWDEVEEYFNGKS